MVDSSLCGSCVNFKDTLCINQLCVSTAQCNMYKNKSIKYDANKRDWSLLPFEAVEEAVKILEMGAKKYGPENWKQLPDFRRRYINAAFRHLVAYAMGEDKDPESGLSHMAHLQCNAMFLLWHDLKAPPIFKDSQDFEVTDKGFVKHD